MFVQRFKGALYILASGITWYFVKTMSEWVVARRLFPVPVAVLQMGDAFYHGLGFACALILFTYLMKNQKSRAFIEDVAVETSKVTWPTMKETVNATIVVSVAIMVAGFAVGLVDWAIGAIFRVTFNALIKG